MITADKINIDNESFKKFVDSLDYSQSSEPSIISYVSKEDETNLYSAIKLFEQNQDNLFYYSIPEQNFYILTSGESFSHSFKNTSELKQFYNNFSVIKNNLHNNFETAGYYPPIFFFTAKFPSDKTSEEWEDFTPTKLFIPELILIKYGEQVYSVININSNSVNDKISLLKKFNLINERKKEMRFSFQSNSIKTFIKSSKSEVFSDWQNKVNKVLKKIDDKEFAKVVLSRKTEFNLIDNFEMADIAFKLDKKYPECYNFIYKVKESMFFGASPEKLLVIKNSELHTEALAGSIERGNSDKEDKEFESILVESSKDIDEHVFVIDHLKYILNKYCSNVKIDASPSLKKLSNIQHLYTGLKGNIKSVSKIFSLLDDIFPTPAIGGYPAKQTINVIDEVEDFDRGMFSGFLGWMNLKDDCELIVSIRSALINKNKLFVYAGCGIVSGSDPEKEFEETQLKAEAIISLFNNENKS